MTRVVVIGIGQSLRGDDAVGLEAVRQWQEIFPETANEYGVRIEAVGLPGLRLLDMLENADAAILVDAVQSSASAGTIHHLNEKDLSTITTVAKSAHGWGVAETLEMGRALGKTNGTVIRLIGIEIECMNLGSSLSESVQASLTSACQAIQEEVLSIINV
ncbi:MAG TPA: hydrogenase maturation protease [Anaerolineales bacterium]|nr:hydrogenase maturation protease [Anaerolineales bacterium]